MATAKTFKAGIGKVSEGDRMRRIAGRLARVRASIANIENKPDKRSGPAYEKKLAELIAERDGLEGDLRTAIEAAQAALGD